ncbi:MAG: hypothetical protein ACI4EH_03330 [Oliverpabstia sp.]
MSKHNGEFILVDCAYTEDWDMEKRRSVAKDISSDDYMTYLAIVNDEVVGIAFYTAMEAERGFHLSLL